MCGAERGQARPVPEPFLPRRPLPGGLSLPVAVDPTGRRGPTRAQSRSSRWRRVGHNAYVPASPDAPPEQRILDATAHLGAAGAVTGWAALRLHEAAYFDGRDTTGERPVQLVSGSSAGRRSHPGVRWSYEALPADDVIDMHGLRVASPARALFDELRLLTGERASVAAADMAVAAHAVRLSHAREYVGARTAWRRAGRAIRALERARAGVRSPMETALRLIWTDDAGLPEPAVNAMIFDRAGRFVACADLLDEEAGLVVEYDGAAHAGTTRRARDAEREEACRALGLEYTRVVSLDLRDPTRVVSRLRAARSRARFLLLGERPWTTEWPAGWVPWF